MKSTTTTTLTFLGLMCYAACIAPADTPTARDDADRAPADNVISTEVRLLLLKAALLDPLVESSGLANADGGRWLDDLEVNLIVHTAQSSDHRRYFTAPRVTAMPGEAAQTKIIQMPRFVGLDQERERPTPIAVLRLKSSLGDDGEGGLRTVASLTLNDAIQPELTGAETITTVMPTQYRWAWRGAMNRTLLLELPSDGDVARQIHAHVGLMGDDDAEPSRVLLLVKQQLLPVESEAELMFPGLIDDPPEYDHPQRQGR